MSLGWKLSAAWVFLCSLFAIGLLVAGFSISFIVLAFLLYGSGGVTFIWLGIVTAAAVRFANRIAKPS